MAVTLCEVGRRNPEEAEEITVHAIFYFLELRLYEKIPEVLANRHPGTIAAYQSFHQRFQSLSRIRQLRQPKTTLEPFYLFRLPGPQS